MQELVDSGAAKAISGLAASQARPLRAADAANRNTCASLEL